MLAKPYFIMILTMSKIVKLKSGDRLLAEIELFIFFLANTIPSSGTSLIYSTKHFSFKHNLYFAVNSSFSNVVKNVESCTLNVRKGKRQFVSRDKVFPLLVVYCCLLENMQFTPFLSVRTISVSAHG